MTTSVSPTAFEGEGPGRDHESLRRSITNRLLYSLGKDRVTATPRDWFHATALAVRDCLIEQWMKAMHVANARPGKRVYYLSAEFLTGRLLSNSLLNIGLDAGFHEALADLDVDLDDVRAIEQDAALGNGGLGRLAACILDSMATLSLPGTGYGIRYEYGLFYQAIEGGAQVEHPDTWLRYGNPWELPRPEVLYPVRFGGRTVHIPDERGSQRARWVDGDTVFAMACDTPVPGYDTATVNNLRLWSAKATRDFNLQRFNEGNYFKAVEQKTESENLSKVLYPDDSTQVGRELRLKQQYFFVSASLQDIVQRFLATKEPFDAFPDHVAIQLNDTHPAIGIPELMRLLVDEYDVEWERAWEITRRTFAYTNHTLMPEALETWPASLFERVLPRHLEIIYEINQRFLDEVRRLHPTHIERIRRMSIVDEEGGRRIRMANLAIIGSHRVNGVSQLHTDLMRTSVFADFHAIRPDAFVNITNGITPRRWLHHANPGLSALITETHRRWVGHRPAAAGAPGAARGGCDVPRALPAGQGGQQTTTAGADSRPGRPRRVRRVAVRHPGQADARIQTAAPQRAARHHTLQPHSLGTCGGTRPAHGDLQRQGGPGLCLRQARDSPHPRGGRRGEPRSVGG
jgi:starch phosphorylase